MSHVDHIRIVADTSHIEVLIKKGLLRPTMGSHWHQSFYEAATTKTHLHVG